MEVNSVMQKLGFYGRWQTVICILICLIAKFPIAWQFISIVWIGYKPPHHCKIPDNSSLQEWIPSDASGKLSSCSMFVNSSNQTTACTNGWQYDERESGPTIVTKWDLVCDRTYLLQTSQLIFIIGVTIGSLISPILSDKFGRKWVLIVNLFFNSLIGGISAFLNKLEIFLAARFFIGLFSGGAAIIQSVYLSESLSSKNRAFYMLLGNSLWGLALATLPLIAYVAVNWIYFQLFISFFGLLPIPVLIWWFSETVFWLHVNDRIEEAEKVLLRATKMNKVVLMKPILKPLEGIVMNVEEKCSKSDNISENVKGKKKGLVHIHLKTQYSLIHLVTNRFLRRHLTLGIIIMIDNLGYYGVTYMSTSLSTNHFLSGFLNAIVEMPACLITIILVNKYGRKIPIIAFHIVAAIAIFSCIMTVTFEEQHIYLSYATLACNVIFKFFMSGAYAVIFFYGSEIFPTNLRNQGMGICVFVGRLSSIPAPYASFIIDLYPRILYAFFGTITLLGGLLTMVLPETSKRALPETVEDIEAWYVRSNGKPLKKDNGSDKEFDQLNSEF